MTGSLQHKKPGKKKGKFWFFSSFMELANCFGQWTLGFKCTDIVSKVEKVPQPKKCS
jgi:hypothetical protein